MINIHADIMNPGNYFGACGFFELASGITPDIKASWADGGLLVDGEESIFVHVMDMIRRLELVKDDRWQGTESERPFDLVDSHGVLSLRMDWWEAREGKASRWKCFSGRMSAIGTMDPLLDACRDASGKLSPATLLSYEAKLGSRLGHDPRSAWDAVHAGFSPNDHDNLKEVVTYPFSEVLTAVALQTFPFEDGKGREAAYFAWQEPVPLMLARIAATGRISGLKGRQFCFPIENRSKALKFFSFSQESTKYVEGRKE